ncbi:hypothetical protein [Clostridium sp. HCS.1]|uniref:hypothetical protein n=1 Tax=Clostridium sp. HCS.1 TaxID=3238594 RepID=UPI003A101FF8
MDIENQLKIINKEVYEFNNEIRNNSNIIDYNKFIVIIDLLDKFISNISVDSKYNYDNIKSNNILSEILEAFNNNDLILVTDLLEYELLDLINSIF